MKKILNKLRENACKELAAIEILLTNIREVCDVDNCVYCRVHTSNDPIINQEMSCIRTEANRKVNTSSMYSSHEWWQRSETSGCQCQMSARQKEITS